MMQFLLFGTFWFWFIIVICVAIVIRLAEAFEEHPESGWAGFTILITLVLLSIFGNWEFFKKILLFVKDNPFTIFGCILIYIIIGIVWSFFKWYNYLRKIRDEIKDKRERGSSPTSTPIPKFDEEKALIISWMTYWPFSMLWTLMHNLIRDVFNFISDQLKGAYEKVIKNLFKELY